MKKILILLFTVAFLGGSAAVSFASDWDKAGKALTIISGLRLISGGRIDVVGKIGEVATGKTYTNKNYGYYPKGYYGGHGRYKRHHRPYHQKVVKHYRCTKEKYWIPEYRWIKKHVPEHEEYDSEYGTVIIEEHYIRIKEEHGGYWEYKDSCH